MEESIALLLAQEPEAMYLTHYSQVAEVPRLAADLRRRLRSLCRLALAEKEAGAERHDSILASTSRLLLDEAATFGCALSEAELLAIWGQDLELNAQGLGVWLDMGAPGAPLD